MKHFVFLLFFFVPSCLPLRPPSDEHDLGSPSKEDAEDIFVFPSMQMTSPEPLTSEEGREVGMEVEVKHRGQPQAKVVKRVRLKQKGDKKDHNSDGDKR